MLYFNKLFVRRENIIYFFVLISILFCATLIFSAPYFVNQKKDIGYLIYLIFSPLCHQIPERSFHLFNHTLAVCSRCTGIYLGFLAGVILYPFIRRINNISLPQPQIFIFISLPMVIDITGNFFHFWTNTNLSRAIIGIIWGIGLPFYFIPGIIDLFQPQATSPKSQADLRHETCDL
ncbi:MAG: DUF2085 domain-containing protein [Candidatus Aminicenantia bacterium]